MGDIFREGIFAGKVVFAAGASGGINLAIAQRFAEAGARAALISRDAGRIEAAALSIGGAGKAIGMAADVRDYGAVEAAFAQTHECFGPIDFVISGAAGNFLAPALGMSANAFKAVVDIDLLGTFNVFKASFAYLNRPGASLIAITSAHAVKPVMFQAQACAAKAGVDLVTKTLAMEWGPAGVRVNAIAPGPIEDTEGMRRLAGAPAQERLLKSRLALRAYGTKRDVADAAIFLCSDNARYITGTILNCDGGASLGDASGDALAAFSQEV